MSIQIIDLQISPNGLAFNWNDKSSSFIEFKELRIACPCANCKGESDIFGNIYKSKQIDLKGKAYEIVKILRVGHYAIRIIWGDGHSDGIFTYKILRELDLENEI